MSIQREFTELSFEELERMTSPPPPVPATRSARSTPPQQRSKIDRQHAMIKQAYLDMSAPSTPRINSPRWNEPSLSRSPNPLHSQVIAPALLAARMSERTAASGSDAPKYSPRMVR